jgi:signal transduction histidine kinase
VRPLKLALLPAGIVFGLVAEWASYESGELHLAAADFVVGCLLIGCGVVAWDRRPQSGSGGLMTLAGYTWFLGNFGAPLLFLHRGPLVHLHLSYPTGRLPTRLARTVVAVAYVDAVIEPLARNDWLTLALSAGVAAAAVQVFLGTSGPARKAGGPALAAALAFASVLALGALERLAGGNQTTAVLWIYDIVIASVAVGLLVDLLRGRWADAVVTGLVVDLGASEEVGTGREEARPADSSPAGSANGPAARRQPILLRAKLARALGDPSLVVGYRVPETGALVDDAGRPVALPSQGSGKAVTELHDRGQQIAVLVHDEALLADPRLLESVAAAARIAVANPRLQAEARARADELEASRRRIVEAGDAQRRRLEQELRLGAARRLDTVAALLADARRQADAVDTQAIMSLEKELGEAQRELGEFARGVHPAALTDGGLMPALAMLAQRSAIPVTVSGEVGKLPGPAEAALYFVCSEALTNTTKHAEASRVQVDVRTRRGRVVVVVEDNGTGGADVRRGSGLRGLADRLEALGGSLRVDSPAGSGTRVVAEIPVEAVNTPV